MIVGSEQADRYLVLKYRYEEYPGCPVSSESFNTLCPIKTCDYIFYNNFNNKCPITIIFGIVSNQYSV